MATDFLYQFIHAMNSEEKRYFRRNYYKAQEGYPTPLYIKLFETICQLKSYDEKHILNELSPELKPTNLSYTKNYLLEQINNALIELNELYDEEAKVAKQLFSVRIYRRKGFFNQALKVWKKAMIKARELEIFPIIQQLKVEYRIIQLYNNPKFTTSDLENDYEFKSINLEDFGNFLHLQEINYQAILLRKKSHFKLDNFDLERINELLQSPILLEPTNTSSFGYKHYFNNSMSTLLYLKNDPKSYSYALKNILDWLDQPQFIKHDPEHYLEVLYMFYYSSILANEMDLIEDIVNNPANEMIGQNSYKSYYTCIKYLALNRLFNRTAQYEKVKELLPIIINEMDALEPLINSEFNRTLKLSVSLSCFALEDFNNAHYFAKSAILMFNDQTRKEQISFTYLFLLIVCYELKDIKMFDIQYKASYAYFYNKQKLLPFEKLITSTLNKAFHEKDYHIRRNLFIDMLDKLNENNQDPIQKAVFNFFNIPYWIESKIHRKPYKEWVYFKKYGK